jgi:two-component system phosphate regulon sensor histidine kinase PhoR
MRLHWKWMLACLSVLVMALASAHLYLDRVIRDFWIHHLEQRLLREVRFARVHLSEMANTDEDLIPLINEVGVRLGVRTTLINGQGRVLADSETDPSDLSTLENHADHPEISAVRQQGRGTSVRYSNTQDIEVLYVATAVPEIGDENFVLRLALPLRDMGHIKQRISQAIWMTSILGLCLALLLAYATSRYISRPILDAIWFVRNIASGRLKHRTLRVGSTRELHDLGTALDDMRRQIQTHIGQITLEKSRLEAVLTSITEAILVTDQSGRILMGNGTFEKLFGVSDAIEGRMPIELVRHRDVQDAIEQTLKTGQVVFLDLTRSDSRERHFDVQIAPILQDDHMAGSVTIFYDITELRRLERIRKDFVANVSHELRTPLTTIKGCASTLADGALDDREASQRFVKMINTHADRLHNLVEDILDLSRIESGALPLETGVYPIHEMINSVVGQIRPLAKEKTLTIEINIKENVQVQCDHKLIEQALFNLLDNAVKYTPEEGKIWIQTRDFEHVENDRENRRNEHGENTQTRIALEVKDTGIGIPLSDMDRIFERFYRVDKGRSRAMGGTGLGLSIVRHIMDAHGERVYVESEQGKGSTFGLTLPGV